jgi:Bacterial alpha-L-rhamnosidase C-terminal domain
VRTFLSGLGALTVDRPGGAVPQYVSPFVTSFELDTAGADRGIALLRKVWSPMLRGDTTGTFWENVSTAGGPQLGSYTSYSHGWAAAPTSYLTTKVLGVQPDGPGFSSFTVAPDPGSLQWAEGAVPTPRGTITVAWKRTAGGLRLRIEAPAGTTYTATLPGQPPKTGLTGTTELEAGR